MHNTGKGLEGAWHRHRCDDCNISHLEQSRSHKLAASRASWLIACFEHLLTNLPIAHNMSLHMSLSKLVLKVGDEYGCGCGCERDMGVGVVGEGDWE